MHGARTNVPTRAVSALLGLLGYTITKRRAVPAAAPVTLTKTPTDAIYRRGDLVFEVPIAKCVDSVLFSFGPRGCNPFVETLREYGGGRHTTYEGSILNRYYETFQPRTYRDLFLGTEETDDPLARYQWSRLAIDGDLPRFPWQPTPSRRLLRVRVAPDWTYGPMPDAAGQAVFSRFTAAYDSIRRDGYRPTAALDGEIRGYFLRRHGDYRFLIRDGLHRTAALATLGHARIRAKFRLHYPRTIDLGDLENWPQVKAGSMDAQLAEIIFLRFFGDGEIQRARNIGLP